MTNEELVIRIKAGIDTAENMALLYQNNKGHMFNIARKLSSYAEIEDLMQEGYLGLCEAVEHYDSDQENKFLSYASFWINQGMRRYIENNGNVVRLPSHFYSLIVKYKKFVTMFQSKYSRNPTDSEISRHLGISPTRVEEMKKHMCMGEIGSLDSPIAESEDSLCVGDKIAGTDNVEETIIEDVYKEQLKEDLWQFVADTLTERERKVIECQYRDNRTQLSIADELGISNQAVSGYTKQSLKKLRRGAKSREFRAKYEEEFGYAWRGSLSSFRTNWTSSTERVAMRLMEL